MRHLTEAVARRTAGKYRKNLKLNLSNMSFNNMLRLLGEMHDLGQMTESDSISLTELLESERFKVAHETLRKAPYKTYWYVDIVEEYWNIVITHCSDSTSVIYQLCWLENESKFGPESVTRIELPVGYQYLFYKSLGEFKKIEPEIGEVLGE